MGHWLLKQSENSLNYIKTYSMAILLVQFCICKLPVVNSLQNDFFVAAITNDLLKKQGLCSLGNESLFREFERTDRRANSGLRSDIADIYRVIKSTFQNEVTVQFRRRFAQILKTHKIALRSPKK